MIKSLTRHTFAVMVVIGYLSLIASAAAADYLTNTPSLADRLTPAIVAEVFPGVDRIEVLQELPPAAAAYSNDVLAGYIFSTLDVLRAPGYDGTPFDVIAGVSLDGKITGALNLFHHEPLIVGDERLTASMERFLAAMPGTEARMGATNGPVPGFLAGATATGRAFKNAIREGARLVLRAYQGGPEITEPTVNVEAFTPMSPEALLADGSVVSTTLTNADLEAVLAPYGLQAEQLEVQPQGAPDAIYLQLRVGLATPAMIGRNATTRGAHDSIFTDYPTGTQAIIVASNGRYDFQGFKFQNASSGYRLERLQILQGDKVFTFDRDHYMRAGMVLGRISGMVILPPDSGFDPLQPWSARVLVYGTGADGQTVAVPLVTLDYTLPATHVLFPEPEPLPAWMEAWRDSQTGIIILGTALSVLTAILAFQSRLSRSRRLHRWVRLGFLAFTFGWLGWIAGGQLSIVHLINYLKAPFELMNVGFYLAEPLIVILSVYTAISLVLLGRGVFCGWLCPFGALQELLANLARWLRLPQWNPSDRLQSRLWWGKYASLAIVVGLAFLVPTAGSVAAEVEPFKTAISAHFLRAWPYVMYAAVLLGIGLFTERAFCRFLCPLGGALALLDRLHLLNLLRRRPECGSPCHLCEHSCPVRAIKPSGKIVMAECFQCLDCQVEYYDDHRCPPLAQQRKQRERQAAGRPVRKPAMAPATLSGLPRAGMSK